MNKILLAGITAAIIPFAGFANEYTNQNQSPPRDKNEPYARGFIGANASVANIEWSDDVKTALDTIELAEVNIGIGLDGGIRFGKYTDVYNFGFTINYDHLFNSAATIPYPYDSVYSEISTGFSAVSLSFDNYIKIDEADERRTDFVFGFGAGRATERVKMTSTAYGKANGIYDVSDSDDGNFIALKFGINSEINDTVDWNAGIRFMVPTNSDSDMESITLGYLGIRRKF